ncbi:hypothetical protein ACWDZW_17475, partial [Streptomyces coeruleorubidus]
MAHTRSVRPRAQADGPGRSTRAGGGLRARTRTTTGDEYTPLQYLSEDQARLNVYNSLLSEYAAM